MTTCLFEVDSEAFFPNIAKLYQRTEKSLHEDVALLKEWMQDQPHLPEIMTEKKFQNFLIRSKFSIEKAKQKIDMYYTIRSRFPDLYEENNPECDKMKKFMECIFCVPLPKPVDGLYRVMFTKVRDKKLLEEINPEEAFKHVSNILEIRMLEDYMFGEIAVVDLEGFSLKSLTKLTSVFLAKGLTVYEKVCSISLKAVYFINCPSFVGILMTALKTVMKPKLFQRIHVCEDTSILKKSFDAKVLPRDYGGEEISLEEIQSLLKEKFHQYRDRFDKLNNLRVNESLRPEKLENDETLGFYGNFKKLDFD